MKILSSTDIQLLLEHINDYLGLGIEINNIFKLAKFKLSNGKIHIPLSLIHLATPDADEQLYMQEIFPCGKLLDVSFQHSAVSTVSIPVIKLMNFARDTYHFSKNDFRRNKLQGMFSSVPSLQEICLDKICDYLKNNSISENEVSTLRNFQLDGLNGLIFKNNSPVFRMPDKQLSQENNLIDKTPIDPYHAWAIVPYSGK